MMPEVAPNVVVPDLVLSQETPNVMASVVDRPEGTSMVVAPDEAMPEMMPT